MILQPPDNWVGWFFATWYSWLSWMHGYGGGGVFNDTATYFPVFWWSWWIPPCLSSAYNLRLFYPIPVLFPCKLFLWIWRRCASSTYSTLPLSWPSLLYHYGVVEPTWRLSSLEGTPAKFNYNLDTTAVLKISIQNHLQNNIEHFWISNVDYTWTAISWPQYPMKSLYYSIKANFLFLCICFVTC